MIPGAYHFYFGDAVGTPGTILTFFPWPGARRGIHGSGEVSATAFTIPTGSAGYWLQRLKLYHVTAERAPKRLGEDVVRFADPDGMLIELIESTQSDAVVPWDEGTVPAEHLIRGMHGVSATLQLATDPPGFAQDETVNELGANLRLPPWMERARSEIENILPKITVPRKATV
jgi:glyoxalase family protein